MIQIIFIYSKASYLNVIFYIKLWICHFSQYILFKTKKTLLWLADFSFVFLHNNSHYEMKYHTWKCYPRRSLFHVKENKTLSSEQYVIKFKKNKNIHRSKPVLIHQKIPATEACVHHLQSCVTFRRDRTRPLWWGWRWRAPAPHWGPRCGEWTQSHSVWSA